MWNIRTGIGTLLVAAIGSSHAQADGVLPSGKPAGVREAARHVPNLMLIGGAAAVAVAGVAIAIAQSNNTSCGSACDNSSVGTTG